MNARISIPEGTLLGDKIRLLQRIGRGGMGDVWVGRNEATHAELAVKLLAQRDRTAVHDERFRREARLAATISHRNVVRVFDLVDGEGGTLALVMELLRGCTLEDCLAERGPMTSLQAVALGAAMLSAMEHVHQKGIIHRDLKPGNVFLAVEPDGHVIPKLLDFGIAKVPAAGSALTIDGSVLGTPYYMSPEQVRGKDDLDGRSDMFSVAAVLYEMLTGVRPFQRDAASASLAAVLEHEVDPDPRIDPRLWLVIARALAKRPYERYGSCAEFADALRSAVGASEQEIANALQELRPRTEMVPSSLTLGSLALSTELPAPVKPLPWRGILGAALAVAVAVLVGLVVYAKRTAPPPELVATPLAPSAVPLPPPASAASPPPAPPAAEAAPPEEPKAAAAAAASTRRAKKAPAAPKPRGVATTPGF